MGKLEAKFTSVAASKPQVQYSVIIPCFNSAATLSLQLECLVFQQGAEPFEVVVVDNNSSDSTAEVAKSFKKKLNLRIISAKEHAGVSYARNRGVAVARGNYLIFLDSDDAVPEHYIAYSQQSFQEYPLFTTNFLPFISNLFEHGRESALDLVAEYNTQYKPLKFRVVDKNWPILPGGSFGISKSLLLGIGGFDLTFEPGAEDNELAIRLLKAGYDIPRQDCLTIAYRVYESGTRSYRMQVKRAKSAALLMSYENRWNCYKADQRLSHPVGVLIKSLIAGIKVINKKSDRKAWISRISMDYGVLSGYLQYQVFKKAPLRQQGVGLTYSHLEGENMLDIKEKEC